MGRYPYISRYGTEKSADFEVVENVMEQAKVTGLKNKKFNELSGGEKQRVAIAQALVQETPVLLLDEPTSHLDINFQIELMELFRRLNTVENKTILGVFHDINLAVSFAESAVFMKNGSVYTKGRIDGTVNRENIRAAFGSDVYVGKNPVTGKIYVSPYFSGIDFAEKKDVTAPEGRLKKIHVIGGGGEASPVLNYLNASGYQVTCGVVNNFDNDLDTAIHLGIAYVSEAPFSPISLYSQNKNMEYIRQSDIVILPPVAFGHGNFPNLIVVKEALDIGKKVIIITGSNIKDRDYTGGKASELYEKIIRKGVITVESINQLKNLI
jgi:iron complex transport system ATP-binding protein